MRKNQSGAFFYLKKISVGVVLSLFTLSAVVIYNAEISLGEIFISETMPNYMMETSILDLYELFMENLQSKEIETDKSVAMTEVEDIAAEIDDDDNNSAGIVGLNNVVYLQDDEHISSDNRPADNVSIDLPDIENLRSLDYLRSSFYVAEKTTDITEEDFNADRFLSVDFFSEINEKEPQILIFHTHSGEMYADSDDSDVYEGVFGLGRELADILKRKYNINSIHDTGRYDFVNSMSARDGSYERMEKGVAKILADNPSVEIAIDIHRDGVSDESVKFVTELNGKPTAQIMFVNGLSKLYQNGRLTELTGLPNPNLPHNLAFSFQMQLTSKSMYPTFTRKAYLKAYRYSLHMLPKSLLVEVGAQTNSKQEALNAMEPLADILYEVVFRR